MSSLGAVALGYGDEEINEAVVRQHPDEVTLSLAHPLETKIAERLVVLPRQVGNAADGWFAAECGVWAVMIVDVYQSGEGGAAGVLAGGRPWRSPTRRAWCAGRGLPRVWLTP